MHLIDKWVLIGEIDAPKHKSSPDNEIPDVDVYEITLAIADSEEEIKLLAAVLGIGEVHEAPAFRTF